MCSYFIFFFFFSSRRRHTRCSRDWSSDVCSPISHLDHRVSPPHSPVLPNVDGSLPRHVTVHPQAGGFGTDHSRHEAECPSAASSGSPGGHESVGDRKSTRLNSSHGYISYAVFCLK